MDRKTGLGFALLLGLGFLLAYAGWSTRPSSSPLTCQACDRPLHAGSRTVGLVDGKREVFCCPACALTAHRQNGKPVKLVSLTDYKTDTEITPGNAYIVEGSDLNLCVHQHMLMDNQKQPLPLEFDRCSPSMIAFANRQEAERFLAQHGGTLLPFQDLAPQYSR